MSSFGGLGRRRPRLVVIVCAVSMASLAWASGASATAGLAQQNTANAPAASHSGALSALLGSLQAPAASTSSGCSWRTQYGNGGVTTLETDTNAAYWATSYTALAGSVMTIQGTFPEARNMSFTVYHLLGAVVGGHLYDAQIQPATGVNPFQQGQTGTGTYTLSVVNAIAPSDPAPNTLYTGTVGLDQVEIIYRVYDPTDPTSPEGDVPLPQTTVAFDGKIEATNQPCVSNSQAPAPGTDSTTASAAPASHAVHARASFPVPEPIWVTSKISGIFADPDNAYLSTMVHAGFGQLVVLQAQMPTFPDTNTGTPPWSPAQVRYWSICQDVGGFPVVVGCVADFNAVENNGIATFVISSPSDQPPNATAADGVNWLPWGTSSKRYGVIIYRQMLADPAFTESIASVPAGGSPAATMGPYLPQIAYCSEAEFAADGAAGCLGSG